MSHFFAEWGLSASLLATLSEGERPRVGRVVEEQKHLYRVRTGAGLVWATPSGRMQFDAVSRSGLPAVGDFVILGEGAGGASGDGTRHMARVLPRSSRISRKAVGRAVEEQIIAANVDTVLIATSLNQELNGRRLERYLTMVWSGGAVPVVLLTKLDLADDPAAALASVRVVALGAAVVAVSAVTGAGLEELAPYLGPGRTVALVGSSGVGKSTLINALLVSAENVEDDLASAALQVTAAVRAGDDKGRHTTTYRSVIRLKSGALLVDTPGMRELLPWDEEGDGADEAFADVLALAAACRFSDCAHETEPECAVRLAIESGDLDTGRLGGYRKRLREQAWLERRSDAGAHAAEKKKWKATHKSMRQHSKMRGGS